jgi:hypothetical protein
MQIGLSKAVAWAMIGMPVMVSKGTEELFLTACNIAWQALRCACGIARSNSLA